MQVHSPKAIATKKHKKMKENIMKNVRKFCRRVNVPRTYQFLRMCPFLFRHISATMEPLRVEGLRMSAVGRLEKTF